MLRECSLLARAYSNDFSQVVQGIQLVECSPPHSMERLPPSLCARARVRVCVWVCVCVCVNVWVCVCVLACMK